MASYFQNTLFGNGVPEDYVFSAFSPPTSALLVKTLVWRIVDTGNPVVLVLKQADKIMYKAVELLFGSKMVLATAADATALTGFPIGQIPPCGHTATMPVYVDSSLVTYTGNSSLSDEVRDMLVYLGPGGDGAGIYICLHRLLQLPGINVANLTSFSPCPNPGLPYSLAPKECAGKQVPTTFKIASSPHRELPSVALFHKQVIKCKSLMETPSLFSSLRNLLDQTGGGIASLRSAAGKHSAHLAAWRSSIEVLDLLLPHVHIDSVSTGSGNYGKSPLFYAITRNRDDVVLHLLACGASVLIVNNKGQTPYSLGLSHLAPTSMAALALREREQLLAGGDWRDYFASHCDGREYGDLDPRFVPSSRFGSGPRGQVRFMLLPCTDLPMLSAPSLGPAESKASSTSVVGKTHPDCRMHEFVLMHGPNVTVLDTIGLTKSLQFTTLESRAEKVTIRNQQKPKPLKAVEVIPLVSFDVSTCLALSGRVIGVQKRFGGGLLARLSPVTSACEKAAGEGSANKYFALDSEELRGVVKECDTSGELAPASVAAVVYLDLTDVCLAEATFASSWAGLKQWRSADMQSVVGCEVDITGKCQLTRLRSAKHTKGSTSQPLWRCDIKVASLVFVRPPPASPARDITVPHKENSDWPIISSPEALAFSHVRSFCEAVWLDDFEYQKGSRESEREHKVLRIADIGRIRALSSLPADDDGQTVVVIDSLATMTVLKDCITANTDVPTLFGLDCEWKAAAGGVTQNSTKRMKNAVSTLQLSTRTRAFVLDLQSLLSARDSEGTARDSEEGLSETEIELNAILLPLFCSRNVLIVGYGIKADLKNLKYSFPHMQCFDFGDISVTRARHNEEHRACFLDLQAAAGHAMATVPQYHGRGYSNDSQPSLASVCAVVLCRELSKAERLSDWTRRPLTSPQIEYAALDALVCCLLFDVIVTALRPSTTDE